MRAQTATARQPTKAGVPLKRFAIRDVFDRIQQTLKERARESKKRKTVYPNETM
jgi:hypothetical protein